MNELRLALFKKKQAQSERLPPSQGALKGQCPDYAHARASSVFSSRDNGTVILTRQDFPPETEPTESCCLQVIF